MPDARYNVSINFTVTRDGSGFQQMQQDLGRVANATEKTAKKSGLRWTELKSQIDLAAGAIRTVGKVVSQALDFGQQGAAITQTTQSFERMNEEIFKTPRLMDDLRAASRGTITDVGLMQGVLKLTAGTSDELGRTMAQAAPQLLEIAKASNKLNPSLGDTAFLYDSISTGIKRASPLILDNLGIVVKVGEANERYAEQLGKSVAALTAEEKQMALLNATLDAGGKLIDQVGGNVDSTTDAYDRLRVQNENLINNVKELANQALTPLIEAFLGTRAAALEAEQAIDAFIISDDVKDIDDYRRALNELRRDITEIGGLKFAINPFGGTAQGNVIQVQSAIQLLAETIEEIDPDAANFEDFARVLRQLGLEVSSTGTVIEGVPVSFVQLAAAIRESRREADLARHEAQRLGREQELQEKITRKLGDEYRRGTHATQEWSRAQIDGLQALRTGLGDIVAYEQGHLSLTEAFWAGITATDEYIRTQGDLRTWLEEARPVINDFKNEILGVADALPRERGRAAFEIFVEANQAKEEIEEVNRRLDGIDEFYKTEVEVETETALADAQSLEDELDGIAAFFERETQAIEIPVRIGGLIEGAGDIAGAPEITIETNAAEVISDAEKIAASYDEIPKEQSTQWLTPGLDEAEQKTQDQLDRHEQYPTEQTTEFFTPGLDSAIERTGTLESTIRNIPTQKDITINVHYNVDKPPSAPGVPDFGGQTGGHFIVPPGYDEKRNPFIVAVESGEEVIVRTQTQQQQAQNAQRPGSAAVPGGDTFVIHNNTREAAALTMAMVDERGRRRRNAYMGVGG